jgi:uroporphyrinogen decarboxylase
MPKGELTSRERVTETIRRRTTDRTPFGFRAEDAALVRINRYRPYRDTDALLDALDIDIRQLNAEAPPHTYTNGAYQNMWGERYIYKPTEYGPVREDMPWGALGNAQTMADLQSFPWPANDIFDYSHISGLCRKYKSRALMYGFADIWQRPSLVRGMENFLEDLILRPELCHYLSDVFTNFYIEDYRRAQKAAKGKIDIFMLISDLGSQHAPLISAKMFREFVLPYIKKITDVIHELGAYAFFHTCGMVYPFIPDLIAAGIDILDPIQPCAPLMEPERLKNDFGGQVCFHGGIDIQGVLVNGTPEEVKDEVNRYCGIFNTGYICAATHLLQPDIPAENMLAMYERGIT